MILEQILERKRRELDRRRQVVAEPAPATLPGRDFAAAIRRKGGQVRLIGEIKRASPSRGMIRAEFDPAALARAYQQGGAAALSVLTDYPFFQGELPFLPRAKAACCLPVLRKDFILDEWQVWESAGAGADAVLLIAAALEAGRMEALLSLAREVGLAALVEVHREEEVERALGAGARMVGINNRDLATFQVDLNVTERLRPIIPAGVVVVSESGISSPDQVRRLADLGVDAVLVGEALMKQEAVADACRELMGAAASGNRQPATGKRQPKEFA